MNSVRQARLLLYLDLLLAKSAPRDHISLPKALLSAFSAPLVLFPVLMEWLPVPHVLLVRTQM